FCLGAPHAAEVESDSGIEIGLVALAKPGRTVRRAPRVIGERCLDLSCGQVQSLVIMLPVDAQADGMEEIFPWRQRNDSTRANHLVAPRHGSSTERRDVGILLRALQYQAKPIEVREAKQIIA